MLDRSLELNPNNAAALAYAAALHAYSGNTAAAISLLDRSTRHNPLDWNYSVWLVYMITYFVAAEYERAAEWSAKALQELPHSTVALRYRAASLGQLGRLEEGRQVVQRLLALFQISPSPAIVGTSSSSTTFSERQASPTLSARASGAAAFPNEHKPYNERAIPPPDELRRLRESINAAGEPDIAAPSAPLATRWTPNRYNPRSGSGRGAQRRGPGCAAPHFPRTRKTR